MSLSIENISDIAQIIQIPILIISALLIWHELKQNIKLTKASNVQKLSEVTMPFMLQLLQDKEFCTLLYNPNKFDSFDEVDKKRYLNTLSVWLTFHENIFYQYNNDLLEAIYYKSWRLDLKKFIKEQDIKKHWDDLSPIYQDSFVQHIDKLISELYS